MARQFAAGFEHLAIDPAQWTGVSAPTFGVSGGDGYALFDATGAQYLSRAITSTANESIHHVIEVLALPSKRCTGGSNNGLSCTDASGCPGGTCCGADSEPVCIGGSAAGEYCAFTDTPCTGGGACSCTGVYETVISRAMGTTYAQCALTLGSDAQLRLYWNSREFECAQSTNNGAACDERADCTDINPGEAQCGLGVLATSPVKTCNGGARAGLSCTIPGDCPSASCVLGAKRDVLYTCTVNSPLTADVSGSLFVDGRPAGGKTATEGLCFGGTNNGYPCHVNGDCDSAFCVNFSIENMTQVQFGKINAGDPQVQVRFYSTIAAGNTIDPTMRKQRILGLRPNAASVSNWVLHTGSSNSDTQNWQTVDDTATGPPEGRPEDVATASCVYSRTQNDQDRWGLSNISLSNAAVLSTQSMTTHVSGYEINDNSDTNKTVRWGIGLAATPVWSTPVALDLTPGPTPHHHEAILAKPSGGAWTETDINNLTGELQFTATTGLARQVEVTAYTAEVQVLDALPSSPNTIADINGDGRITVCVAGDSRWDRTGIYDALNGLLSQPTDIIDIATGGRWCGDVLTAWTEILDGQGTANMPAVVKRGAKTKCDVIFLDCSANDLSVGLWVPQTYGRCYQKQCAGGANAGQLCNARTPTPCPGGSCTAAGPQQGGACWHAGGTYSAGWIHFPSCIDGVEFGAACTAGAGCTGQPGSCQSTNDVSVDPPLCWCVRGSTITSPQCPSGVCVARTQPIKIEEILTTLIQQAQARTGSSKVRVILGSPYLSRYTASPTDQTYGPWPAIRDSLGHQRAVVERLAAQYSLDWIDQHAEWTRRSPTGNADALLLDGIHPNADGDEAIAQLMADCLLMNTGNPNEHCTRVGTP